MKGSQMKKNPLEGIKIRGAESRAERETAVDMMSKIFIDRDYFTSYENGRHLLANDNRYVRLALRRKEIVGHVGIWPVTVCVGQARLKTAGIYGVCTRPDMRKKGIATFLLKDAIATAEQPVCLGPD